jgi:imidazolonepropionase-like amidohydrolase
VTTFTNAHIFDGRRALPGLHTVTLEGNRIGSITAGPAAGEAIDLGGMTLMPGLITCHSIPISTSSRWPKALPASPWARNCPPAC